MKTHLQLLCFAFGVLCVSTADSGIIETVAGGGDPKFFGDGGQATDARLSEPQEVVFGQNGDLYVLDAANHRVRKIDSRGVITTVAGTGEQGPTELDVLATNGRVYHPGGLAIDQQGNLYLSDPMHMVIKIEHQTQMIRRVAGTAVEGSGGDGGPATDAQLFFPRGIYVNNSGEIFVSTLDHLVRKVDASNIISTFAGDGFLSPGSYVGSPKGRFVGDDGTAQTASLNRPYGMTSDSRGVFYIADACNHRIRAVNSLGRIYTVAGGGSGGDGGPATQASLREPQGVFVNASLELLIAETGMHRIRKVDRFGVITTLAGGGTHVFGGDGGPATEASLNTPYSVIEDADGNLYISDTGNHRIRKVSPSGEITTIAGGGIGDGGLATAAILNQPGGVAKDNKGFLYIADTEHHRVRKVSLSGEIRTIAGTGIVGFSGDGGQATKAQLNQPANIFVDRGRNVYIADQNNHRIRRVDRFGMITTVAGNGEQGFSGDGQLATTAMLDRPVDVCGDLEGNLYISDRFNHRIRKVDRLGMIQTVVGTGEGGFLDSTVAVHAQVRFPNGIHVTSLGELYIADQFNHRIRKVDKGGMITTVVGSGTAGFIGDDGDARLADLRSPLDVFVDLGGNIFVVSEANLRVRKVDNRGIISTVAGSGQKAFTDDGIEATLTGINVPVAIHVDEQGDLFIVERDRNRIRKVEGVGAILPEVMPQRSDFDGNGRVDFADFLAFVKAFGLAESTYDLSGDGKVDFADFLMFARAFGK